MTIITKVTWSLRQKKTNPMPDGKVEKELSEGFADFFLSKSKK
jgi:hypothetical protein